MKSNRFFFALSCLIIAIIVLSSFARTIGSYFLEDDIGEVLYVHQIFSGHWQQAISNFTGNYMGVSTMKVYRPCLLLSIMADYAIWKTNASGYFATNIFFLIATALALYMVLIELTRSWDSRRSILFAFFSAALFASSPLHCESVSLMVGRVDIICAFFYLLALWSFIRKGENENWTLTLLGVLSFWLSLLTKEMAIGLPVVLTAICFLFPSVLIKKSNSTGIYNTEESKLTMYRRFNLAIKVSYPLWLSCLIYFVIRYFALSTFLGGYIGSVGANQFSHIFEKWTDLDTIGRIIFPLNQSIFTGHPFYHNALLVIYCVLGILIFAKFIISGLRRIWLVLLAVWIITALAPIYQLWGLGFNLEGARFLFFLTIPLAILLPLLIFAPPNIPGSRVSSPINILSAVDLKILAPSILALISLVILDTAITAKNNIPWVHAGKQIKSLLQEGQKLAQKLNEQKRNEQNPNEQDEQKQNEQKSNEQSLNAQSANTADNEHKVNDYKAIVLGIPKEIDGAHIIYNGLTFNFLMSPPFSANDYSNKFITFDPILYGNANLINTSRFRRAIVNPNTVGCYMWQPDKMMFEQLVLPAKEQAEAKNGLASLSFPLAKNIILPFTQERGSWESQADTIEIKHSEKGTGIAIGPVAIDPFTYDFMEIEAVTNPSISAKQIKVFWSDDYLNTAENQNMATALCSNSPNSLDYKIYRVALSRYWRWFPKSVQGLWLEFPPAQSISIKNIRLLSDQSLVPKIEVVGLAEDNTGVYQVDKQGLSLQIDASRISNCARAKLEISKANYFFDNFDSCNSEQAVMSSTIIDEAAKTFVISNNAFPAPGYYQLRVIGLDKEGNHTGEWSDPLTVKI